VPHETKTEETNGIKRNNQSTQHVSSHRCMVNNDHTAKTVYTCFTISSFFSST